jgi:hypothetical protein
MKERSVVPGVKLFHLSIRGKKLSGYAADRLIAIVPRMGAKELRQGLDIIVQEKNDIPFGFLGTSVPCRGKTWMRHFYDPGAIRKLFEKGPGFREMFPRLVYYEQFKKTVSEAQKRL